MTYSLPVLMEKRIKREIDIRHSIRVCGECTACCEIIGVPELAKPYYAKCEHVCEQGCGIYPDRPNSCKTWECMWREGIVEGDDYRPDKSGVMLAMTKEPRATLGVYEVKPGALEPSFDKVQYVVEKLQRKYLIQDVMYYMHDTPIGFCGPIDSSKYRDRGEIGKGNIAEGGEGKDGRRELLCVGLCPSNN